MSVKKAEFPCDISEVGRVAKLLQNGQSIEYVIRKLNSDMHRLIKNVERLLLHVRDMIKKVKMEPVWKISLNNHT